MDDFKNSNSSFWEKESFLRNPDVIVLGGGIVGVNCAISLKEAVPEFDVMIVERGNIPIGASTRNAGFACFGSVTELLNDLSANDEDQVFTLLHQRYNGLNFLRSRVGDHLIDYGTCGGYEVFDNDVDVQNYHHEIQNLNEKIFEQVGLESTFNIKKSPYSFTNLNPSVIYNAYEGRLHPGKMMLALYELARQKGVRILNGINVDQIIEGTHGIRLVSKKIQFECAKLIVCTNGFTNEIRYLGKSKIAPKSEINLDLKPARNQVLVTEEIPGLKIDSCFHYHQGYVYFRNIGKRLLIGGGRHIALTEEATAQFGITGQIKAYLQRFLVEKIGISESVKIESEWSGIMGVGAIKSPILRKQSEHVIFAVRLGGMGIALGSLFGDQAAKLLLKDITI